MTPSLDRTKEPVVKEFDTLTLPTPELTILPNGIHLYTLESGDQPLNRITLSYGSGSIEAEIPDALQLAVQLIREGTSTHSGREISEMLDYHGAWLKADALSHDCVVSLWSMNKSTKRLLPLLKEIVTDPMFPDTEFVTLKQKHKARYLLSQKNVTFVAAQNNKKQLFGPGHPINHSLNENGIEAITRADVRSAFNKVFTLTPRVFVAGGEMKSLLPDIIEFFGKFEVANADSASQIILPMTPVNAPDIIKSSVDAEHQSAISISLPTIDRHHPDYVPLRLVIMALGGYFGSRLMANIREDKGYTYGIQASLLGYREGGAVSILTNTAPQYVDAVIGETRNEINKLRDTLMSDDELSNVKRNAMTSLAATLDTPFSIMDQHITYMHNDAPVDYFAKQVEAIKALSSEQIADLAQKYLDPDKLLISIAGPE